jgi:hypothetical protein
MLEGAPVAVVVAPMVAKMPPAVPTPVPVVVPAEHQVAAAPAHAGLAEGDLAPVRVEEAEAHARGEVVPVCVCVFVCVLGGWGGR